MKLFIQEEGDSSIHEYTFMDVFVRGLAKAKTDHTIERGQFGDESSQWVEMKEIRDDKVISFVIHFDIKGEVLTDINMYETPIEKVERSDKTKKLF